MLLSDGLHDIHQQLERSGEPLVPSLAEELKLREPRPLLEVHDLTLKGLAYEIKYSDYWNSTGDDDGEPHNTINSTASPLMLGQDNLSTLLSCRLRRMLLSFLGSTITLVCYIILFA